MAQQTMHDFVDGEVVVDDYLNPMVANIRDVATRMSTAESKNSSQDTSISTLNTRTADSKTGNAALGTRVTSLESGASTTVLVIRALAAASTSVNLGLDLDFGAPVENQGGWTVSGGALYVPVNGVYEFVMQAVWDSPTTAGAIPNLGCYITRNGSAGGVNGLAANERVSAANQTVMQCLGRARLSAGDYLVGRVYTSTATTLRGSSNTSSYGGTYLSVLKIAS